MTGIKIIAGEGSKRLGMAIAKAYAKKYGPLELVSKTFVKFSDGEFKSFPNESVRGKHVFIVQSTFMPLDNFWELVQLIDAAKRASADKITAVIPYFGFARQDRKSEPRTAISAKLSAKFIEEAGANSVILMDLHADQIQGFFEIPVNHLFASSIFIPHLQKLNLPDLVIAAPDLGATKRVRSYGKFLTNVGIKNEMIFCDKTRAKDNEVEQVKVYDDSPIEGKNVILIDDMIDTGGTMIAVCEELKKRGVKSVRIMVAHGVLSGKAYQNINNSCVEEVIVTDSIPLKKKHPRIKVLSIAEHFAEVIKNIYDGESISKNFLQK